MNTVIRLRVICAVLALWAMASFSNSRAQGVQQRPETVSPSGTGEIDTYTPEELRQMSVVLRTKASDTGTASETLKVYPGHFSMLAFRNQSGGAELHDKLADLLIMVGGSAILQSGGTIVDSKSVGPGETRGVALTGYRERTLHLGDVIHIPAGVPHLMKLEKNTSVLYFVVKIQQAEAP
jgi:mannose-6-phosphate isomerase-like protein (cupin superfamily)